MNDLGWEESPAKVPLHDETMFHDVTIPISEGMVGAKYLNVPARNALATIPMGIVLASHFH